MTEPAQNCMHAQTFDDNGNVFTRLTMVLNGEPRTWIQFDIKQLDGLIAMLQARSDEMVQLHRPRNRPGE